MNAKTHIKRKHNASIRKQMTWDKTWQSSDQGLIVCWENGKKLADKKTKLAQRAKAGELPALIWGGGVEDKLKSGKKEGSLYYLAQWQGLRGDDLDIDLAKEYRLTCSRTKVVVTFNKQQSKKSEITKKSSSKSSQSKKQTTKNRSLFN